MIIMQKATLSLLILMASTAWADTVHTILGGVVKSVSWVDQEKGTESQIVVKDTTGKTFNILVTSTTTLWDAEAKAIMLDKGIVKKKVNVIYLTTDEGIKVGKSIKILK